MQRQRKGFRVYFIPFLIMDNSYKNSILNCVFHLNVYDPNTSNNVSFYYLIKHQILHIVIIAIL